LAPLRVIVPVPFLTRPPLPERTPAKRVFVLSPPVVNVPIPSSTLLLVAALVSEAIV